MSLEAIKGTLLAMADQILTTVSDIIIENAEQSEKGTASSINTEFVVIIASLRWTDNLHFIYVFFKYIFQESTP